MKGVGFEKNVKNLVALGNWVCRAPILREAKTLGVQLLRPKGSNTQTTGGVEQWLDRACGGG